ncbi:serine hydrolase domain-containing protein [Agromyces sp. NPDC056965]|uniref:serine hydrolase domain-containing protein n=1 Tax=Agromyces sp. NPDC056965 TaxID=3345983 RepID=UPI00363BDBDC
MKHQDYFFHMRFESASIEEIVDHVPDGVLGSAVSVLVAVDGEVVLEHHSGVTRRWDAPGAPNPLAAIPVTTATRFDLASVTKPIVAAALVGELHSQSIDTTLPAAELLPEFEDRRWRATTVAQLLGHTAGLPAEWFDRDPDPGARRFRAGARPERPAGAAHRYSCVGYIWAGLATEALAGAPLDEVVHRRVLGPLGMDSTGFRPAAELRPSIAATELQPTRGLVHGEVHDETAAALGGVSGNAGLFATGRDLLRFSEALRTGGEIDGSRVLPPAVAAALVTPLPLPDDPGFGQALGPRLDEDWMRSLGPRVAGHTGFTGTAFATEPGGRRSVVLLSNRVHPTRSSNDVREVRARVIDAASML